MLVKKAQAQMEQFKPWRVISTSADGTVLTLTNVTSIETTRFKHYNTYREDNRRIRPRCPSLKKEKK